VQYAGVRPDKIEIIPVFYEEPINFETNTSSSKNTYFIWSTNITIHKNHKIMLDALIDYYAMGGMLDCYITGVNTELFGLKNQNDAIRSPYYNEYVQSIHNKIKDTPLLRKHIKIKGNLPKKEYYAILSNAKFLVHPGYGDNGNGACFEALFYQVPVISCDYPAMRFHNSILKGNIAFFEKRNKDKLVDLMINYSALSENNFKNEELIKHTISSNELCIELYKKIRSILPDN